MQVRTVDHGLQCRVADTQFTRNAEVPVTVQSLFYLGLIEQAHISEIIHTYIYKIYHMELLHISCICKIYLWYISNIYKKYAYSKLFEKDKTLKTEWTCDECHISEIYSIYTHDKHEISQIYLRYILPIYPCSSYVMNISVWNFMGLFRTCHVTHISLTYVRCG